MVTRTVLASLVLWTATASAQPGFEPDRVAIVHKDPSRARLLSVIGTLSAITTMYFGSKMGANEGDVMKGLGGAFFVIGPAWGTWWAEDRVVLTPGMALRLAGLGMAGVAYGTDGQCNAIARTTGGGSSCIGSMRQTASDSMLGLGVVLGAAGVVYDFIDAGHRAERRRLIVVPTLSSTFGGLSATAAF